jgi:hypothetical protein
MVDLTLPTAGIYFLGALTTFWCLFVGIANFKTRNDPGGTVTMEVTRQGETKVIEVDRSTARGGVGLGGSASGPTATVGAQVSDGGATDDDIREVATVSSTDGTGGGGATGTTSPDAPTQSRADDGAETWKSTAVTDASTDNADRYCGNCEQFEYVRTERGIQPYCGFHDGVMADMDACEEWTSR